MCRKSIDVRIWKMAAGVMVLAAIGGLVVSSGAKPLVGSVFASQGTPWYEEGQQSVLGVAASSQPAIGKEKAENPAFYAKALSAAFHNAANAVLPSVVSITNLQKPMELPKQNPHKRKPSPDDEDDDIPFGFRGSPFGDLFRQNPDLRDFLRRRLEYLNFRTEVRSAWARA